MASTHEHFPVRIKSVADFFPEDFRILDELGRGANNRVFLVLWEGEERVLRCPRRRSDTQQQGNAKWEYIYSNRASEKGFGPELHGAWYMRHASGKWRSGLYILTERFQTDIDGVFQILKRQKEGYYDQKDEDEEKDDDDDDDDESKSEDTMTSSSSWSPAYCLQKEHIDQIGDGIFECLSKMANIEMIHYDLKASNIVVHFPENPSEKICVRIIDYGRDFCERREDEEPDNSSRVLDMLRETIRSRGREKEEGLLSHIIVCSMLMQLSCTISRHLKDDRRKYKTGKQERLIINPVLSVAKEVWQSLQGRNKDLVRSVLRNDEVKSVLQHYHGRRDSGTHRTILAATEGL